MGFVTNAGWVDGNATDGLRKYLNEEFSKIYVFHLRGNARTSGELRRKEKGNVFGGGTRSPIAITFLVKNVHSQEEGQIFFHDIGDYLDREQKLAILKHLKSIDGIRSENKFQCLEPDENHDWINQGEKAFSRFIRIGDKKDKASTTIFDNYSSGVKTNRDSWCFNFSNEKLEQNMRQTISFYESEVERYFAKSKNQEIKVEDFISGDTKKIKWNRSLRNDLRKNKRHNFDDGEIRTSLYRPFSKQCLYFSRGLNNDVAQIPKIFPKPNLANRVIVVGGPGATKDFSCLMTDCTPEFLTIFNGQCFPLKLFAKEEAGEGLFANQGSSDEYVISDGITDEGLLHFQSAYASEKLRKEDLFYYLYGLLHSRDYRDRFQNNLSKKLPRIPTVNSFKDFKAFSKAGRKLGDLHVNYEAVEPDVVTYKEGDLRLADTLDPESFYRVQKMKFAGKRGSHDRTTVIYNHNITMTDIPLEAYEYVVNGKSALEWVMDRQCIKTDKKSGIVNDANDYANETMNNPAYPLELFQRVITVSLETIRIVRSLPKLDID